MSQTCQERAIELRRRGDQHRAREERQRTDPEFGVRIVAMPQHVAAGVLQRRQRGRDFCDIAFAIGSQPHRARARHEQFGAELFFQPADSDG